MTLFQKTLGGLRPGYYFRELFFGAVYAALFAAIPLLAAQESGAASPFAEILKEFGPVLIGWLVVNTLLYPFARFVLHGVVGFMLGDSILILPLMMSSIGSFVGGYFMWSFAVVMAPIALIYLFFRHSADDRRGGAT